MKPCLIAMLVVFSSASLWAADDFGRNPPTQQIVRLTENGELELIDVHTACVPYSQEVTVFEEITVEVNGKTELQKVAQKKIVTKMKTVQHLVPRIMDANLVRLFETDGRTVELKGAGKRLSKPTLVVRAQDGKMIAPYYASVFKPGTLILSASEPPTLVRNAPGRPVELFGHATNHPLRRRSTIPTALVSQVEQPKAEPQEPAPPNLGIDPLKSAAPVLLYARVPTPDKLNLRSYSEGQEEKEVTSVVIKDGKPETVTFKQLQKHTRSESTQLALQAVSATTADGKAVDAKRLPDLLKAATTVFVMTDGQPADPFWLTNVKPGVLVLVTPEGLVGGGYYGHGSDAAPVVVPSVTAPGAPPPPPAAAPMPPAPKEGER